MTATIKHTKTNNIADWTQVQLNTIIAGGAAPLPPAGTVLNDVTLPSDWNASHTISGVLDVANLPTATSSTLGIVQPDNSSITISNGVISSVSGGSGTVSTTGSPASGNMAKFSGALTVTNGNLSGDITTTDTLATTLATVNSNVGSFGSSTSIPSVTVNAKGLVTAASGNAVIAPAGTLTGTTLASNVVTSSLTTVGTIGTGTWQGTKVGLAYGGTNADLSATGGTSQVLKQVSSGAAVTVAQLAASDLSNGTTGSGGGVVLATGPTLSNPVVGTQTSSDNSTKAASTAYVTTAVTNALNGLDWKTAAGYATTANVVGTNTAGVFTYTSTGVDTIDGHQLALNDVVLFKNQTTQADNGVWVVTTAGAIGVAGILTRRSDYNAAADIHQGDTFYVINGTANANTAWVQTAVVSTINSDALTFSQVAGPGSYVAGNGVSLTGNSFAIDTSITVDKTTSQTLTNKTLTSPTLTTPALGTPASGVLTNCTGTASGLTAGNVTTNANLTGAVTSSGNATTLVSALTFSAGSANSAGSNTYTADAKAAFGYTINSIRGAATASGSITLAVKINGTNVTGLSAVSITSTPGDTNATAANVVAAGDRVTWVFSSSSSDLGTEFTMKITRT